MIAASHEALEAIREHGREAYPEECCGALLGFFADGKARVTRVERIDNARADERRRRFHIEPPEYTRVERLADAEGLALLGFYHSHPDHPAAPSDYDREHALPFFHYVVLAVASAEARELTAWVLSEDRQTFEPEMLVSQDIQE